MTHVKNNAVALGVHILLCGCFSLLYTFLDDSCFPNNVSKMLFTLIIVIVCVLGYFACGFFLLRPVERFPFLSVSSLAVLIVVVNIIIVNQEQYRGWGYGEALALTNPTLYIAGYIAGFASLTGIPFAVLQIISLIVLLLGPLFPSLLIFLGMFLGKKFRKAKAQEDSAV